MTVQVKVRDATSDRQAVVEVPSDLTVGQARPQLLEALGLSVAAHEFGEVTTHMLYRNPASTEADSNNEQPAAAHAGPCALADDEPIAEAVHDDDELVFSPEAIAGRKA